MRNKNIKSKIIFTPIRDFAARVNATTATAIPEGMFNVMYNFSLRLYS